MVHKFLLHTQVANFHAFIPSSHFRQTVTDFPKFFIATIIKFEFQSETFFLHFHFLLRCNVIEFSTGLDSMELNRFSKFLQ